MREISNNGHAGGIDRYVPPTVTDEETMTDVTKGEGSSDPEENIVWSMFNSPVGFHDENE